MALVGTRVQTVHDGENTVAVKTDVVLDTETGLVLERQTVLAEVITESGNHKAVVAGQQTRVAAIQVLFCACIPSRAGLFLSELDETVSDTVFFFRPAHPHAQPPTYGSARPGE